MKGTWTTTDGGGSGAGSAVAVVLAAIAVAAIAGPVIRAAVNLLETVLLVASVVLGVATVGVAVIVALRLRPGRQNSPRLVYRGTPVTREAAESLTEPRRPAIERAHETHIHFHGISAEDVAAIIRQAGDNR